ncbi:uncharacterized protein LOC108626636 isoform X1 [Ceratina calcarata]|uniref:Uncharacterized protein LOC108626636 isoform X1 n=1 Tax=Ceratina calcarata TaxID=156304 RepID=A0AAJ7S4V2_9HYME|nr:uncharacterized protein LOC108626636 isoform X1 [Ceratina calcarata]XP_026670774.1 uncharacterized protein LOC108626636 isoform X1 [Ceratina calcarata]XP_026670775.1 uncharacterized protein LOC108626636 isoform X1 [Ceratina calcarata]
MLRLPVIVVLVISMFAGRVSPVMPKEVEMNDKGNDTVLNITNSTVNDTISNNISNKSIEETVKKTEIVTEKLKKDIYITVPPDASAATPVNDLKKVENKTQNCTSNKEAEDMLHCKVMPHDNDDNDNTDSTSPLNATEPTTTVTSIASNKTEVNAESQVPEVQDKEPSGKNKTEDTVNTTRTMDQDTYKNVTTEPNHLATTNHSDVLNTDLKQNNSSSEASVLSPLLEDKAIISSDNAEAVKSAERPKAKRMPSGIIALVTAISFAVVIGLVYIGMIVWRRYIEYRYGHRELLVNELEFDTNDLRHFEL